MISTFRTIHGYIIHNTTNNKGEPGKKLGAGCWVLDGGWRQHGQRQRQHGKLTV